MRSHKSTYILIFIVFSRPLKSSFDLDQKCQNQASFEEAHSGAFSKYCLPNGLRDTANLNPKCAHAAGIPTERIADLLSYQVDNKVNLLDYHISLQDKTDTYSYRNNDSITEFHDDTLSNENLEAIADHEPTTLEKLFLIRKRAKKYDKYLRPGFGNFSNPVHVYVNVKIDSIFDMSDDQMNYWAV